MEAPTEVIEYVETPAEVGQSTDYGSQQVAIASRELEEIQALRSDLASYTDGIAVLMAQDDGSVASTEATLSTDQYDYLVRSLQLNNTLSLVIMLLVGATCGLCAWRAFVHSWGSHG